MKKWAEMSSHEQNALVAEKVFGWQEQPCDLGATDGELTIYDNGDASCPRCGVYEHIGCFVHGMIPPAPYTTSLDAAWSIAELHRFGSVELKRYWTIHPLVADEQRYGCRIIVHGTDFYSSGSTPTEAICLAALRAVGYEFEEEAQKTL